MRWSILVLYFPQLFNKYQVRAQVIAVATAPSASTFPFFLCFVGQKKGKADADVDAEEVATEMENIYWSAQISKHHENFALPLEGAGHPKFRNFGVSLESLVSNDSQCNLIIALFT